MPNSKASTHEINRRGFLIGAAAVAGMSTLPVLPGRASAESRSPILRPGDPGFFGLTASLRDERSYAARVSGKIPADLRGTLYRNGPGLFERDGFRKRCLLDGDGMIQAIRLDGSGVHYQNRFIQTAKYRAEEEAGRFLYPTWTTPAPGGAFRNLGIGEFPETSGVNAVAWGDSLYALEDANPAHRMDFDLETLAVERFGEALPLSAHPKIDARRGEWVHFGFGVWDPALRLTHVDRSGKVIRSRRTKLPTRGYVHDFFVSPSYIIISVNPIGFNPMGLLLGTGEPASCFRWNEPDHTKVFVFRRDAGPDEEPLELEAPPSWMWHSVNAFERDGLIHADFIGYDDPDHFIGDDPAFWAVMDGREVPLRSAGTLRRWTIDPNRKTLREETLRSAFDEYPCVDPRHTCGDYDVAFVATVKGEAAGHPWNAIARLEIEKGTSDELVLGDGRQLANGETVFAPSLDGGEGQGWLLPLVYDRATQRSELWVVDAERLGDGPVARVHLEHHTPLSFHGSWRPASTS